MSFWDDLTGKSAADASAAAAEDTYKKQLAASGASRAAGSEYAGNMQGVSSLYDPFVASGGSALQRLMGGLGLGGPEAQAQFTQGYRGLPGYTGGLEAGSQAITGNAAARGMLNSGGTLKGLQKFGSNYEDQRVGDYLTRLMNMSGTGLQATGAKASTLGTGYGGQLNANLAGANQQFGSAPTIGQGMIAGANAEAAGAQNLLNTGLKIGGMALGGFGGGSLSSLMGGGFNPVSPAFGSNPFTPSGNVNPAYLR